MKIFDANKDQLTDPDKIKPGQVLKIPRADLPTRDRVRATLNMALDVHD